MVAEDTQSSGRGLTGEKIHMKRIFTFGCSMTEYQWPTWADILCYHYNQEEGAEAYNYASSGMGNEHIVQALTAADLKHTFTNDDIICVLWSSWIREDRLWQDKRWGKQGSILNCDHDPKLTQFVDDYFSLENYIMKNITAIHTVNKAYNINFQDHIFQCEEPLMSPEADKLLHSFYFDMPGGAAFTKEDVANYIKGNSGVDGQEIIRHNDGHPSPIEHLLYLENNVLPALGISQLNTKAREWIDIWDERITKVNKQLMLSGVHEYTHSNGKDITDGVFEARGAWGKLFYEETNSWMSRWEDLWDTKFLNSVGSEEGVYNMLQRYQSKYGNGQTSNFDYHPND